MNTLPAAPDAHAIGAMVLTLSALFLFSRQWLSLESSGLATITALIVGFELFPYNGSKGPLGANDFLAGFGNPALITIVALLICSKALDVTGALHSMTRQLARFWSKQPRAALLVTMFGVATASMFMNNTPLVAMVLPIPIAVCLRTQTSTSSVLMPVGYATIIGGMATTIGTSTNLLVANLVEDHGLPRFGMFDFALPAIIAGSASILLIWFLAPYLLPDRTAPLTDTSPRLFRGVLQVGEKSVAAGKTLAEIRTLTQGRMQIERIERGEDLFVARLPTVVLRPGDRLYVRGQSWQLKEFEMLLGTSLRQDNGQTSASEKNWLEDKTLQRLAEIVVTSSSPLYGQTVRQSPLLAQYGLSPIAVHAPKAYADDEPEELNKLENQKLRIGDVVPVQGGPGKYQRPQAQRAGAGAVGHDRPAAHGQGAAGQHHHERRDPGCSVRHPAHHGDRTDRRRAVPRHPLHPLAPGARRRRCQPGADDRGVARHGRGIDADGRDGMAGRPVRVRGGRPVPGDGAHGADAVRGAASPKSSPTMPRRCC